MHKKRMSKCRLTFKIQPSSLCGGPLPDLHGQWLPQVAREGTRRSVYLKPNPKPINLLTGRQGRVKRREGMHWRVDHHKEPAHSGEMIMEEMLHK